MVSLTSILFFEHETNSFIDPKFYTVSAIGAKKITSFLSMAYFDKYTAEILKVRPYESFSGGDKVRRLIYPIHTGSIFGYPTKILAFLICLFALTLPVIWLGRKKKKKR